MNIKPAALVVLVLAGAVGSQLVYQPQVQQLALHGHAHRCVPHPSQMVNLTSQPFASSPGGTGIPLPDATNSRQSFGKSQNDQ